MPHIVVDYAAGLEDSHDIQALCAALYQAASACPVFTDPQAIKVRARPCPYFVTGGTRDSFVHVNVHLIEGRTSAQKRDVTSALLKALDARFTRVTSLSVDIHDITRASYAKRVL